MPRDGAGTYNAPEAEVVTGTPISSTSYNASLADIGATLTASIAKDGQTLPTAALPMATFNHTNVGNATARNHYAAMGQVQDGAPIWGGTAGGTANARTIALTPSITAYAAGQRFTFINGAAANSGPATLAVSGLAATPVIREVDNAALVSGEMQAGTILTVTYNGSSFVLEQGQAPLTPVNRVFGLASALGAGITLPGTSGERYMYFAQLFNAAGAYTANQLAGSAVGGTVLNAGVVNQFWSGFCWRVS